MKKYLLLLLLLLPALLLSCRRQGEAGLAAASYIHYINREETKVVPQEYEPDGASTEELIIEYIGALETDPENVELKKPIGSPITLIDYYLENDQLHLDFDEHYSELDKVKEVLIRAAIVRTLVQIPGVDFVSFRVNGTPLVDSNNNPVGIMTADSFLDNSGSDVNAYDKVNLRLYFANRTGDRLVSYTDEYVYNSNVSLEKLVVERIISGPLPETEAYPVIPPATKIISVTTKDGICYVNLSEDFLNVVNKVTARVAVYSLVNSLSELGTVNKVQLSVNGATEKLYRDSVSLTAPLERDLDLLEEGEVK